MNLPEELRYARTHEWVRQEGDVVTVGITDHAQEELGDIVFVELPEKGAAFKAGEPFGSVESVKTVSDLNAQHDGEVTEVNEALSESPELINSDPYGGGWMIQLQVTNEGELLSAGEYEAFTKQGG